MKPLLRGLAAAGLATPALAALAHGDHGSGALLAGLTHPLAATLHGLTHLADWPPHAVLAGLAAALALIGIALHGARPVRTRSLGRVRAGLWRLAAGSVGVTTLLLLARP